MLAELLHERGRNLLPLRALHHQRRIEQLTLQPVDEISLVAGIGENTGLIGP